MTDGNPMPGSAKPLKDKCGSKLVKSLKRYGQVRYCIQSPLRGKKRCRSHGGATPTGFANANTIHGRYSKAIPARYLASMEESLGRPDFKNNRQQVAMLDARMDELFGRLESGEHGGVWNDLQDLMLSKMSSEVPKDFLKALNYIIKRGQADAHNWAELRGCFELRRRQVETDSKIAKVDAETLDAEQTMFLVSVIISAAREYVPKEHLQAFSDRVAMNTPGGVLADEESEPN